MIGIVISGPNQVVIGVFLTKAIFFKNGVQN